MKAIIRKLTQILLGATLIYTGTLHLTTRRLEFQAQVPPWVPFSPDFVVLASGVVEVALGLSLISLQRRREVGVATAAFLIAIFPGNISQFVNHIDAFGLNDDRARAIRLLFQPLLVLWALWSTSALDLLGSLIGTMPQQKNNSLERPDFIGKASESIYGPEVPVVRATNSEAPEGVDYNYDVVGESFQRDHLTVLIRVHNAFESGQIYSTAILELEPSNPFDSSAVKVVVEGTQVGYIPKFDSPAVTQMVKKSGKSSYEVPVRIGWDTNSPSPLIGVRLALTVA